MKSHSLPIPLVIAISHEITQKFANFSLKITKNRENCHSRISRFPKMVKRAFTLVSRKFWSRPITNSTHENYRIDTLNWMCAKFSVNFLWNKQKTRFTTTLAFKEFNFNLSPNQLLAPQKWYKHSLDLSCNSTSTNTSP